jgi:hypothetical protein
MITMIDAFAQSFDSIDIEAKSSRAAIEHAMEIAAAQSEIEPGFYLSDNAGGRFVVDRDTGLVTLADPSLIEREADAVHRVRLRVIENSRERYEIDLNLRVTGDVPQLVGADELATSQPATEPSAPVAKPRRRISFAPAPEPAPEPEAPPSQAPKASWSAYAVADRHRRAPAPLHAVDAAFGAIVTPASPPALALNDASLALGETPPAPSAADASWSL